MNRKLLTKIFTFSCLIPVSLVSIPLLVIGIFMWPVITFQMGLSGVYESILHPGKQSIGELVPALVPLGIWGLFTLWALARHYIRHDFLPNNLVLISAGLASGFVSSIQVMISIFSQNRGGDWIGYMLILSLVCGSYFVFLLFTSDKSFKSDTQNSSAV